MSESANNNNTSSAEVQTTAATSETSQPVPNNVAQNLSYYIAENPNISVSTIQSPILPQPGQVVMQPVVQPGQQVIMQPVVQQPNQSFIGQPVMVQQPGQSFIQQPGQSFIQQPGQSFIQQPVIIQQGQPVIVPQGQTVVSEPPPTYQQSQGEPAQVVQTVQEIKTTQQEVVYRVENTKIPKHSAKLFCPFCKKNVITLISFEDNLLVWGLCFLIFIFGLLLCCIPFCIKDLKDVVHYCPNCRVEIARRKKLDF